MLLKLLILTIAATIVTCQKDKLEEERIFNLWLKKYNLNAPTDQHFKTWKTNVIAKFREIEKHNAAFRKGEQTFEREINHLSHLSDDEYKARLIGFDAPKDDYGLLPKVAPDATKDLPDYFNWHDKGVVHKVQDQNACGSCYVFASIGAIEAHACLYNNICEKLSEQEALECSGNGCSAGKDELIYNYTADKNGATYSNYTYKHEVVNQCSTADNRPRVPGTKVKGWQRLPNDAETIRFYLYNNGPMYVIFDLYKNLYDYKRGIYSKVDGPKMGCHCVLLVGYGTENGIDYFIYKNSWDTTFGEQGYFRAQRGINLANFEGYYPSYPVLEQIKPQ